MNLSTSQIQAGSIPEAFDKAGGARILTINVGSSSLKFALFAPDDRPTRLLSGQVVRIGAAESLLVVAAAGGDQAVDIQVEVPDQAAAVALLMDRLGRVVGLKSIAVVGHRGVHGGNRFNRPERITPEVLEALRR